MFFESVDSEQNATEVVGLRPLRQLLYPYLLIMNLFCVGPHRSRPKVHGGSKGKRCCPSWLHGCSLLVLVVVSVKLVWDWVNLVLYHRDIFLSVHEFIYVLTRMLSVTVSFINALVSFVATYHENGVEIIFHRWSQLRFVRSRALQIQSSVIRRMWIYLIVVLVQYGTGVMVQFIAYFHYYESDYLSYLKYVIDVFVIISGALCAHFSLMLCTIFTEVFFVLNEGLQREVAEMRGPPIAKFDLKGLQSNYYWIADMVTKTDDCFHVCIGTHLLFYAVMSTMGTYDVISNGPMNNSAATTTVSFAFVIVTLFVFIFIPSGVAVEAQRTHSILSKIPLYKCTFTQQNQVFSFYLTYVFVLFQFNTANQEKESTSSPALGGDPWSLVHSDDTLENHTPYHGV